MTHGSPRTVRVTRRFDASPERVFDAWLDPESARRWLFATPTGAMVRAEIDARVGGSFVSSTAATGRTSSTSGVMRMARPRRLVFSFAVPKYSPDQSRVTVEIRPDGDGCELTLTAEHVPAEWASRTEEGWRTILDALAERLG